ncbi:hypothetical protein SVAN01_09180 [Stagonosporopsis vannaccii]|nr:hypothetical protein SVAN01_09180 [Stagonosporopsis vannaccii]
MRRLWLKYSQARMLRAGYSVPGWARAEGSAGRREEGTLEFVGYRYSANDAKATHGSAESFLHRIVRPQVKPLLHLKLSPTWVISPATWRKGIARLLTCAEVRTIGLLPTFAVVRASALSLEPWDAEKSNVPASLCFESQILTTWDLVLASRLYPRTAVAALWRTLLLHKAFQEPITELHAVCYRPCEIVVLPDQKTTSLNMRVRALQCIWASVAEREADEADTAPKRQELSTVSGTEGARFTSGKHTAAIFVCFPKLRKSSISSSGRSKRAGDRVKVLGATLFAVVTAGDWSSLP